MENIQIETTQNVIIEHEIANVGERILAHFIDWLIFLGYIFLLIFINSKLELPDFMGVILVLPLFLYDLVCEITLQGQSVGKKAMKIKVVKLDGSEVSLGSYLLRWMFRLVDNFLGGLVAIITISVNGKGQRLGDMAAGTTVIRLRKDASLTDTILVDVPDDYTIKYQEVAMLTDKDIKTLKNVLAQFNRSHDTKAYELITRAASAIERRLNITANDPPYEFLQNILRDYNFMHRI